MLIILILATPKFKFLTKEETQQYLFLLKVSIPKNIQILVSMLFNDTKYIKKKKTFTQPLCGDVGNPES